MVVCNRKVFTIPQMTVKGPPDWRASPYNGVNPERIEQHENVTPNVPHEDKDRSNDYVDGHKRLVNIT